VAESNTTKLVVIGGGPGGYAAAFHAADLGMEVALVDANAKPGGVCLHRGCIPSKALLHVARLINEAKEAANWGVAFAKPTIQVDKVRQWKDDIVGKLTGGVLELCKQRKVRHIPAYATFTDANTLELRSIPGGAEPPVSRLSFEHAILATGSHPVIPPPLRVEHPRVMDSTAALELPDVPNRLLIVGGGYIGLELGCVYAAIGAEVTVVEMTDAAIATWFGRSSAGWEANSRRSISTPRSRS
jgi:dihydrolipoamide dehydrogenase